MQYSVFGSILTIGAMVGAMMSGRIADYTGRRGVCLFVTVISTSHIIKFYIKQLIYVFHFSLLWLW